MSWFSTMTGIQTESADTVARFLSVAGTTLISDANAKRFECGRLETPSLSELRSAKVAQPGAISIGELVADVQALHQDPENAGAFFQVASQFNLLEMLGPTVRPEDGIGRYEDDFTQGPACAIACGAGTVYRNYFHPVKGGRGQSVDRQVDCLDGIAALLDNEQAQYWRMQNGYALASAQGLAALNMRLSSLDESDIDALRMALKIGLQKDTEVTLGDCGHLVTQAFCSALPVAYSHHGAGVWGRFARIVLEACYEATLHAAAQNAQRTGNNKVFLTLIGGGAFGNDGNWIFDALLRALLIFKNSGLNVFLVSYGRPSPEIAEFLARFERAAKV